MSDFDGDGSSTNTLEGSSALLTTLVTCTGLLYFKHIWTLTMQGGAAIKAATRVPEDFTTLGLPRPVEVTEDAKSNDLRWRRIVANDLENIPIGLIVLWSAGMAVSAKHSKAGTGVIVLTILFTIMRFFYTYAFMKALQPWRTVFWMGAVACVVVAALLGIIVAFQAQFEKQQ